MSWIIATWIAVGGYVLGAPLIWHLEQWWLGRKLHAVRWVYHLSFYTALPVSFFAYGWWAPPVFFLGMLLATVVVQFAVFQLCRRVLAPIRVRAGVTAGNPFAQFVQLKAEIEREARRRGLDWNQSSEKTPEDAAKFRALMLEYEDRLHKAGEAIHRHNIG